MLPQATIQAFSFLVKIFQQTARIASSALLCNPL